MKYLLLLNTPGGGPPEDPEASAATFEAYDKALNAVAAAGIMVDCAPLHPSATATTVRVKDGETFLTDGPAAELKEQVGGYLLIDCEDLDEALRWAATIPAAWTGSVEVRTIMELERNR